MKLLVDSENDLLLSPATYWELAIKISIGKYRLTDPLADYINEAIRLYGLKILPITPKHAEAHPCHKLGSPGMLRSVRSVLGRSLKPNPERWLTLKSYPRTTGSSQGTGR